MPSFSRRVEIRAQEILQVMILEILGLALFLFHIYPPFSLARVSFILARIVLTNFAHGRQEEKPRPVCSFAS